MAKRRKKKASIGCLFWIALILLVLVVFLFNRDRIENVLEATGFIDILNTEKNLIFVLFAEIHQVYAFCYKL